MDWQTIERELVDYFRQDGWSPRKPGRASRGLNVVPDMGDWVVDHANRRINLSELARSLAAELGHGTPREQPLQKLPGTDV